MSTINEQLYLVLDQGGHATRAMVFDESAKVVCYTESKIETIVANELEVEHDPLEMLNSVYECIDNIHELLGDDYQKIIKAGIATQRSSIVCWNKKTGEALSPIISWQDRRTVNDIAQFSGNNAYIHDITGLYLNAHYGATKIRWCLHNLPSVSSAYENDELFIAPLASYILFNLLDNSPFVIDPANASRTLLMNYKTINWQEELLNLFSIPKKILPKILTTKFHYGNIKRHSHSIEFDICTGDQSAVIYSEGDLPKDAVFVNAGTGAFILKNVENIPNLENEKLLASVVFADVKKTSYVIEGTVNGAGRALEWYADKSGLLDYEVKMDMWNEQVASPPIFVNAVSGVGSPYWIAECKSYFINEGSKHENMVAVLESIVFLITENIQSMRRISCQIEEIVIAGGLAMSQVFCQKLANLSRCSVRLANEKEASAKGVYFLLNKKLNSDIYNNSVMFHYKHDQMLDDRYTLWCKVMKGISTH